MPTRCVRYETVNDLFESTESGAFCWSPSGWDSPDSLWIRLPGEGEARVGRCRVYREGQPYPSEGPGWLWDGNVDQPTLSPSIHMLGDWHGYLEAGALRSV